MNNQTDKSGCEKDRKGGPAIRKRRKEKKNNKERNEAKSGLTKLDKRTPSL